MAESNRHIFTPEEENNALRIMESLQTAREAASFLLQEAEKDGSEQFLNVLGTLEELVETIRQASIPYRDKLAQLALPTTCESIRGSLEAIRALWLRNDRRCKMKIQFELFTAIEFAYLVVYYWGYVYTHPEREKRFAEEELYQLTRNPYAYQAGQTGRYKYEVSFVVQAYNHLEYTKMCVESLLQNIPEGLNYELILWDNGSSDGTQEYFESKKPDKLLESRINWSVGHLAVRAFEGRYCFLISNDIVILPHAIENMLACIKSDDRIALVVPSTPNVSNLQSVPASYQSEQEMMSFARQNNRQDPFCWEQRVRLCDPIALRDARIFSKKEFNSGEYLMDGQFTFPDDYYSAIIRRNGYKMMLAKDAYCHHFGSVTLKDEIQKQNEQKFYLEGRRKFHRLFGVDPWGTGFCFDPIFRNRVVGEEQGHVEVLGINCGLGGNSLKIKEQIKEYCHNTDTFLCNITDDPSFLEDLKGVSDRAETVAALKGLQGILAERTYRYIVWETPFLTKYRFKNLLNRCKQALSPNGALILKLTEQSKNAVVQSEAQWRELGNDWVMFRNEEAQ